MTELLNSAIAQLKTLPANEQDAITVIILEEIEIEQCWDESFSRSQILLLNSLLQRWLSIVQAKLKNSIQKRIKNYRAVGQLDRDTVIWFWVGSYAEYDKLLGQF